MDPREESRLRRWQEEGDPEALEELLREELAVLKARLRSGGTPGAPRAETRDDVAQEAVMKLLRADPPPRFPTRAALQGYLWTAARNLLVDRVRRARGRYHEFGRGDQEGLLAEPSTRGSLDRIERADLAAALEVALNLLPPNDREILRLVYFDGRSIEEAGRELGIERDVANTRLVRARLRLARKLDSWREFMSA